MISPVYRKLRKRPKKGKTLKTLHPLKIIHFIHFIHFVQEGKLTRHFDGSGQNRTMTIISLYSPDLWGNKTLLHRPGSSRMLPSQSDAAACPAVAPLSVSPPCGRLASSPAGGAKCQPVVHGQAGGKGKPRR